MEYKVGDEVRLKSIDDCDQSEENIVESMEKNFGKVVCIDCIDKSQSFTISGSPYSYLFDWIEEKSKEPVTAKEKNLVDRARLIMKEFDKIRDDLKRFNVNLSISFNGNTGHGIVQAEKTIQL